MRLRVPRSRALWIVALWFVAACIVAASTGPAARESHGGHATARAQAPSGSKANRAAPLVAPAWCPVPRRAPRTRVDLGEGMSLEQFEETATEAGAILRVVGPGACLLAEGAPDPELRAALESQALVISVVAFRGDDLLGADVHFDAAAASDGAVAPPSWRVGVERADDESPWQVVRAFPVR